MASFQDILNTPIDQIKPPKPLPIGTYLCVVEGQPEITKIGKKETDAIIFQLKPMQAMPDVDQSSLLDALEGKSLTEVRLRHTLWGTADAAWRLKQFLVDHLGIAGSSMAEMVSSAMGRQVLVTLGHRTDGIPPQVFMDVKGTAKA